jgi:zinc transporter
MQKEHDLANYNADQCGLICSFLFSAGMPGKTIEAHDAVAWLSASQHDTENHLSTEFIWLHFNSAQASAEKWMHANLSLPDVFYETLNDGSRSTRIEDVADNLIAVLNDVAFKFTFEPSEISTLWMCVNQRILISARTRPLHSIDQLRHAVKRGECFNSSMSLLTHLMHDQGEILVQIVREATLQVDVIEDGLLSGALKNKRGELGKLRRVLVRLQRLLAPEPAALFRFLHQAPSWIAAHDLDELRQSTEEFALVIIDLTALQERIKLLQEEMAAQASEQTNRSLYTLTILTVLALPINIVTGLLGMNVGGIPMAQSSHGFFAIVCIVVLFILVVCWLAFYKKPE